MHESARSDLVDYYAARAAEYERVYAKPERQADLTTLREIIPRYFTSRHVLEIACGTGYWTSLIAQTAAAVVATDLAPAVLAVAESKPAAANPVTFRVADAFSLGEVPGAFDAAFAGFWLSHVQVEDRPRFLQGLHRRVGVGAHVAFVDNRYVEGSSTPIARVDAAGNTYQSRQLDSGERHEVIKNFPDADALRAALAAGGAGSVEIRDLTYFWLATYTVARAD